MTETGYRFSEMGHERLNRRPVIVGAGPCGLFAAWQLTLAGYAPLILERGKQVEDRSADVNASGKPVFCSRIPMYSLEKVGQEPFPMEN